MRGITATVIATAGFIVLASSVSACGSTSPVGHASASEQREFSREEAEVVAREAGVRRQEQRENQESKQSAQAPAATPSVVQQQPGTCRIAPPQVTFPTGDWTATGTVLTTSAIERDVRPWDFRRVCAAGTCKTYLHVGTYYGVDVAEIVPEGRQRYLAIFRPESVPCSHLPGRKFRSNLDYTTISLWWSPRGQVLHGLARSYQRGPCGGGSPETDSYVVIRTHPDANPAAEGP
jgi:hypothetical protein